MIELLSFVYCSQNHFSHHFLLEDSVADSLDRGFSHLSVWCFVICLGSEDALPERGAKAYKCNEEELCSGNPVVKEVFGCLLTKELTACSANGGRMAIS
jgi:hypothetical protein